GAACLVIASSHNGATFVAFGILIAAALAVAWRAEAATAAVPAGAALAALVLAHWALDLNVVRLVAPPGPMAGAIEEPLRSNAPTRLAVGALLAALFGAGGFLAQGRSSRAIVPVLWAASSVLAPLAILVALYYRISGFERSIPFAGIALLLAALFALAT